MITMKRAKISADLEIDYGEQGPTDSPTGLLMLHGYGDSWYSFNGVMAALPADLRAVSLTHRGHGRTRAPGADYSIQRYAEDAVLAMAFLGLERCAVVGHSMGSFIAQEIALRHAHKVSHLVLIGSAVTADNELLRGFVRETADLTDPVPRAFVHEFQAGTCANPLGPGMDLEKIVDESMCLTARVWHQALRDLVAYRDADTDPDLSAITCPTEILWGDGDEIFLRAEQDRLQALIAGANLRVFKGAGHGLHWEQPAACARHIMDLLSPDSSITPD